MKKQRRRRITFTYHCELLCYPNQIKRTHDRLHVLLAQMVADYRNEKTTLTDCKTGKYKGSVRPRR